MLESLSTLKKYTYLFLIVLLVGCKSGDGGDSSSTQPPPPPPPPSENVGGSVANPSQVSFSVKNIISSNSGDNYFKVEVKTGGVLYFDLLFDGAYDTAWITRCYASSYEKRPMTIKEIGGNTVYSSGCHLTNSVSLSKGTYLIKPDLNSNSGYFYASFSSDGTPASGSPSNPIELKMNEDVVIDETMLRNYFAFKGEPGQTLYVDSYLNDSISSRDRTRCREASSGNSYWNHHFVYGICTGSSCNCDTSIEIPLGEDGETSFKIKYIYKNKGYIRAFAL